MTPNLLIGAAIDFESSGWIAAHWNDIVESLRPGIAGDIWQWQDEGSGFAWRTDHNSFGFEPEVRTREVECDEAGWQTLFAGRIFHRESLARDLDLPTEFDDCELYSAAHLKWGAECDLRILGSYAAVQWNSRLSEMRLVRSPLQAPPLHFWRSGPRVIAASLPRTIFAAGVDAKINTVQVANVALRNFTDPSRSYYEGLGRVAPGTQLSIDRERVRRSRFWQPRCTPRVNSKDHREVVEEAERLVDEAVKVTLEGSKKPAISLSGGLDSQMVASFALDRLGQDRRLRSFTAVPVEDWLPKRDSRLIYDESENVRALAECHPNLDASFVSGAELHFGAYSDELMRLGSWPTANEMNMHWVHAIHRDAGSDGHDVMLHAELGDSSVSYDALTAFPRWLADGRWMTLARELKLFSDDQTFWKRAIVMSVMPWIPKTVRRTLRAWRHGRDTTFERWSPLRAGAAATQQALLRAKADGHDVDYFSGTDSFEARESMIAAPLSEGPELDLALRLLHGVSRRDPTAYRPLWEFCASLPDDIFIRDGTSRRLSRELLARRAPTQIANQTRVGIQSSDFRGRLKRDAPAMIEEVAMMRSDEMLSDIFDLEKIQCILEKFAGPESCHEKDWLKLTSLVPRGIALARFIRHV